MISESVLREHKEYIQGRESVSTCIPCNMCDYTSCNLDNLRNHCSGEKSNKCNQSDFASIHASDLRVHLKTHSIEKTNKFSEMVYLCN